MTTNELEHLVSDELLPATISENPPLVIDLPDGQKLVIGELKPGIVIEVATWRGTGRPDSRTNRIMLGVSAPPASDANTNEAITTTTTTITSTSNPSPTTQDQLPATKRLQINDQVGRLKRLVLRNFSQIKQHPQVEIYLQKFKVASRIQRIINRRRLFKTAIFVMVYFILTGPLGFGVSHPESGLKSAAGSATSSLAIIRTGHNATAGDTVIANSSIAGKSPVLAIVASVSEDGYALSTDAGLLVVERADVQGRLVLVVPFIGIVLNWIGQ
jgi:hypothetical protein